MSFHMHADALVDAAYVEQTFSPVDELWLTVRLRFLVPGSAEFQRNFAEVWFVAGSFATLGCFWDTFAGWTFFFNGGGGSSFARRPRSDTYMTLEIHWVKGGATELLINGTSISDGTNSDTDQAEKILIGQTSSAHVTGHPVDIAYVKVGTTRAGSDIFSDDFASGDLSAWDSVFGDVTVVEDGPAPTQVFGGTRFYEAPPWRFIVTDLESNTLTFLDRLGLDRSVTVTRAAARVISVRVPSDNPEVNIPAVVDGEPFVNEGTRLVYAFRRESEINGAETPWVIRAAGIVLETSDDADSDHATTTVTAYDPWKYLYRRPVLSAGVAFPGRQGVSYPAGATADEIILDQLNLADITGPLFFDWGQTGFYTGTIESCDPLPNDGDGLAVTFTQATTLGDMLDILVATGTCDVVFDPIYDPANRPGMVCQMSIYQRAGSFKPNAVMGWDRWPRSVVQLSRQVLGTERANVVQMFAGQSGPPVEQEIDSASITLFREYWLMQNLPGVMSLAGAHTIAQRQLALLKDGQYTYALAPAAERAPRLFEEYREADEVPLYASERFRAPISGVSLRVESIPIVIGDDQLERVNQMLVSYAPESGS